MRPVGFTCKQCGALMGRPHLWCCKCKLEAIEQAKQRKKQAIA